MVVDTNFTSRIMKSSAFVLKALLNKPCYTLYHVEALNNVHTLLHWYLALTKNDDGTKRARCHKRRAAAVVNKNSCVIESSEFDVSHFM